MNENKVTPDLADAMADKITRETFADMNRMQILGKRLETAFNNFKSQKDGGLKGAIGSVEALLAYIGDKRPDWGDAGLLNPLAETLETLRALTKGETTNILAHSSRRIKRRKNLAKNDLYYRSAVSALVDVVMKRRACSLDQACSEVANKLRKSGMPVGSEESSDCTTIKNWRKRTSVGDPKTDFDITKYYLEHKKELLSKKGSVEALISNFMKVIVGIRPMSDES